jgi:hypothetical protein
VNPWVESNSYKTQYLTYHSKESSLADFDSTFEFRFALSDTKIIRSRKVYDIISLIADISGFADVFMVFTGYFLLNFYQNQKLRGALVTQIGLVELKRSEKKRKRIRLTNITKSAMNK